MPTIKNKNTVVFRFMIRFPQHMLHSQTCNINHYIPKYFRVGVSNLLASLRHTGRVVLGSSGQDGRVGRYALLPLTTKRRTTKNNENCQKIELYGSLTNKELKKKHSSRLVGGAEMGSQEGEDTRQGRGRCTVWARQQLVHQGSPMFKCR